MNTLSSILKFLGNRTEIVRTTHEGTARTQNAASQSSYTDTFTKSGYYPLGIVGIGFSGSGVGQIVPYNFRITSASNGSATVGYGLRNNNSSSDISVTVTFHILWQKMGGVARKVLKTLQTLTLEAFRGGCCA